MKNSPSQRPGNCLRQFFQITRSYSIRYVSYLKQKSHPPQLLEQLEIVLSKIINQNEAKQTMLIKLLGLQLKGDYQQIIALTLLQDLAKWSRQNYNQLADNEEQKGLLQAIIQESIKLLNSQQQFHTIVPKQNDLLRELLINPHVVNQHSIENYRIFYRKLKDVKEFYPQVVKENQKVLFLKTIQDSIDVCAQYQSLKTLELIFFNIFAQLQVFEETHQFITSRLKIVKKIVRCLWFFHEQIMYKSSFLVMKFSQHVLSLPHLLCSVMNLYEDLLPTLISKLSPAPLIMFNHLIINNTKKILDQKTPNYLMLQTLLSGLTQIFRAPLIQYFMKNYDANFMEESVCQSSLSILFQFLQNRANQKKYQYQIFRKYLKRAIDNIRTFLNNQEGNVKQPSEKLVKFYQVKRKEYLEIVQDMNQKPKKIFKKLQSISSKEIKQEIIKKYVRIAKKSSHLQNKKMIDVFATNNPVSQELFAQYVSLLFSNLGKDVNLQEFLRFFSSNFFLNGQSQQILRVLDTITVLYYNHQSSKILKNSDSTYTFANAIILLNTDLHNPQNEQKMSVQSFYKMCKRINNGDDLPLEMLNSTYTNIKKNKINTFRQKGCMFGISATNFYQICNKQSENVLEFYDLEMRMLNDQNFYNFWIYDLLVGIIDERQTMKLQQLIQRFVYDDNAYECEVVQLVRKLSKKKAYIPLHALQKILQHANFKNTRVSEKTISYLWLAVTLIENFSSLLPTNVICQILILTWRMRSEIKDDMYLRQKAQMKRIRKMIRQCQKRQNKKSIMDMFSSFLSSKEEDTQSQLSEQFSMAHTNIKKMNRKVLSERIFQVLMKPNSNSKANHRVKAIEFFIGYLRNDEQKIFQEFLSLLYLIFHLLYKVNANQNPGLKQVDTQALTHHSKMYSPAKKASSLSSFDFSSQLTQKQEQQLFSQFQQTIQDLFYQLLGLKQSSITKRIQNLKKKDVKKYEVLQNYCQFWVLKILISKIDSKRIQLVIEEKIGKVRQDRILYLLNKSIQFIQKTDKEIFLDLVYEFQEKSKLIFSMGTINSIQKHTSQPPVRGTLIAEDQDYKIGGDLQNNQNFKSQKSTAKEQDKLQIKGQDKSTSALVEKEKENQIESSKVQINKPIDREQQINEQTARVSAQKSLFGWKHSHQEDQVSIPAECQNKQKQRYFIESEQHPQQQAFIESFIFNYRKIILQLYVNSQRIVGKEEVNTGKEWKWLVHMQKMIQDVIEIYEEKQIKLRDKHLLRTQKQAQTQKTQIQKIQVQNKIPLQHKNKIQNLSILSESQANQSSSLQLREHLKRAEIEQNELSKQNQPLQQRQCTNLPFGNINCLNNKNVPQIQEAERQLLQKIDKQLIGQQPNHHHQTHCQGQSANLRRTIFKQESQTNKNEANINPYNKQPSSQNQQEVVGQIPFSAKQINTSVNKKETEKNKQTQKLERDQMIKQEEEEFKKLEELYANSDSDSSQMLGMPVYML